MTSHDQPHPNIAAAIVEHNTHLQLNLRMVQAGIKSRAAGIRRCQDCTEPYIDDRVGLVHCPDCRVNHRRYCRGCRALIANTTTGERLCDCCRNQLPLFGPELAP